MSGRRLKVAVASMLALAAACSGGAAQPDTSGGTTSAAEGGQSDTSIIGSAATGSQASTASTGSTATLAGPASCQVGPVPVDAGLDRFYTQGCLIDGFWVVANDVVAVEAVTRAGELVAAIFHRDPDVAASISGSGIRLGIIGADQQLTEMPEYRDLYEAFPGTDWDNRARGLGATAERPLVSVGEENLLCLPTDVYLGEDILLHEFAHVIDDQGYSMIDPRFTEALSTAYGAAIEAGTWSDTYAGENRAEYWAEGVQSFFGRNLTSEPANGIHGPIDTRAELARADPALHTLIDERLGDLDLPPRCRNRPGS